MQTWVQLTAHVPFIHSAPRNGSNFPLVIANSDFRDNFPTIQEKGLTGEMQEEIQTHIIVYIATKCHKYMDNKWAVFINLQWSFISKITWTWVLNNKELTSSWVCFSYGTYILILILLSKLYTPNPAGIRSDLQFLSKLMISSILEILQEWHSKPELPEHLLTAGRFVGDFCVWLDELSLSSLFLSVCSLSYWSNFITLFVTN